MAKQPKITKVVKDNWYMLDFEEDSDFEADYYTWSDWMFEKQFVDSYGIPCHKIGETFKNPIGVKMKVFHSELDNNGNACGYCAYNDESHNSYNLMGEQKQVKRPRRIVIFKKINQYDKGGFRALEINGSS